MPKYTHSNKNSDLTALKNTILQLKKPNAKNRINVQLVKRLEELFR